MWILETVLNLGLLEKQVNAINCETISPALAISFEFRQFVHFVFFGFSKEV